MPHNNMAHVSGSALDDENAEEGAADMDYYTIKTLDDAYTRGKESPNNTQQLTPSPTAGVHAAVVRRPETKAPSAVATVVDQSTGN